MCTATNAQRSALDRSGNRFWPGAVLVLLAALYLNGCSWFAGAPEDLVYSRIGSAELYAIDQWDLAGRVALKSPKDAWSADLSWSHQSGREEIGLSGPLGQGGVRIQLADNHVTITHSDGSAQVSEDPELLLRQTLGFFVPVTSLRFWVLGVPEPNQDAIATSDGFIQAGWTVRYQAMQSVNKSLLPKKMTVVNGAAKLKLIIDQWKLNDRDSN